MPVSPPPLSFSGYSGKVHLPEILSAFSFALDLTEDAVPGHALRTCLLGMRIGQRMGLHEPQMLSLYHSLLLKDVGCSSSAARMCSVIEGDDRAMKAGTKLIDWRQTKTPSLPMIRLLWKQVAPDKGPLAKLVHIVKMGMAEENFTRELVVLRCERGAEIARRIGVGDMAAEAVRSLDEHWDGGGQPHHLAGAEIPLLARIASVAQYLDIFGSVHGRVAALGVLKEREGVWFDPEVVKVASSLNRDGILWKQCDVGNVDARQMVIDLQPGRLSALSDEQIDNVCAAFADVVDAKSSFTSQHSVHVAKVARGMALAMGFGPERVRMVERAALLHDIGKLRIPNSILDKAGALTDAEYAIVKEHPRLSRSILGRVKSFRTMAEIAGDHHERLDGTGYANGKTAEALPMESRLLQVADLFAALSEERPYRNRMSPEVVRDFVGSQVPKRLDGDCYEALLACALRDDEVMPPRPPIRG